MSSKRLSRAQRESIIIDFINGKETPGYQVIENPNNGKFIVKAIPKPVEVEEEKPKPETKIEIEEEEINESESQIQLPTIQRTKQNARELLRQLSQLLNEDEVESTNEETNKQGQYIAKKHPAWQTNWSRRKLVLQ